MKCDLYDYSHVQLVDVRANKLKTETPRSGEIKKGKLQLFSFSLTEFDGSELNISCVS